MTARAVGKVALSVAFFVTWIAIAKLAMTPVGNPPQPWNETNIEAPQGQDRVGLELFGTLAAALDGTYDRVGWLPAGRPVFVAVTPRSGRSVAELAQIPFNLIVCAPKTIGQCDDDTIRSASYSIEAETSRKLILRAAIPRVVPNQKPSEFLPYLRPQYALIGLDSASGKAELVQTNATLGGIGLVAAILSGLCLVYLFSRQRFRASLWAILSDPSQGDDIRVFSISRFQLALWTLLIGGICVYVMLLTGALVEITTGTLALLGITLAARVGTQIDEVNTQTAFKALRDARQRKQTTAATLAAMPADAGGRSKAERDDQDASAALIAAENNPVLAMMERRTSAADITRIQLVFFTLITSGFVLVTSLATYRIPEIPDGYAVLLGLSNSIYVGTKFIRPST